MTSHSGSKLDPSETLKTERPSGNNKLHHLLLQLLHVFPLCLFSLTKVVLSSADVFAVRSCDPTRSRWLVLVK